MSFEKIQEGILIMAIRLTKQLKTPPRSERVVIWVSKDVREALGKISEETGIGQQCLADLLLREAMQMVEITENGAEI